MKTLDEVKYDQKKSIEEYSLAAFKFVDDKIKNIKEVEACLLSGSVARGDYWPGDRGGAIDLTIIVQDKNDFNPNERLGITENKSTPFHMVKHAGQYFQIKILDYGFFSHYQEFNETEKFAIFESRMIIDKNELTGKIEVLGNNITQNEIRELLIKRIEYAQYLINDYKVERWKRRDAVTQLNQNLNKAIEIGLKCLFHINGLYSPAEDRALYYSYSLKVLPERYAELIDNLLTINDMAMDSYQKREKKYKEDLVEFILEWMNDNLKQKKS